MLSFHLSIPEGAVKYSNTVRELQGESSADLVASGKLFSGARWSQIHNISSPEGVISQLQQGKLETKHWVNIAEWTN